MSTRSIVVVTGKSNSYHNSEFRTNRLYKHCDGYPNGNLPIIFRALLKAEEQYREAQDIPINVEQITGLLIGYATNSYGQGAQIEESFNTAFRKSYLGNQGDLEWIYIIDIKKKNLEIYSNHDFEIPQQAYDQGTVDPTTYANGLKEEYKEEYRQEIIDYVKMIKSIGWKVNGEEEKSLVTVQPERRILWDVEV